MPVGGVIMYLTEKQFVIKAPKEKGDLLEHLGNFVERNLGKNKALRFAITSSDQKFFTCEIGVEVGGDPDTISDSIFNFVPRGPVNSSDFNTVMLVPTGIGAEVGGHAGDATPAAKLLASVSDNLVTHPNVLNGSDIIELPQNALYVEGSVIARLMMGTAGLRKVRKNRVLVAIHNQNEETFTTAAINAVNAARASYGLICPRVVRLEETFEMKSLYTNSGRASGKVSGMDDLLRAMDTYRGQYDAAAISSVITVPLHYHRDYFTSGGDMINPWGGVEALLTHALSSRYNVPTAHSPMLESVEVANIEVGISDPRMAAEVVSVTFLLSVLKGLQQSPAIVSNQNQFLEPDVLTARDISCLVVPDHCIGLPTLAALEQDIPVVAVKENRNLMANDLTALPWKPGQLHFVENYWEAAGVIASLRIGIDPLSVRRPFMSVDVDEPK